MKKYVLLVETGSDLPADLAAQYDIYQAPMHVSFGAETRDDGSFPISELFGYYDRVGALPKTSGCTIHDFEKKLDELHAKYPDRHIIHLAYSAVTTCSFQSCVLASEGRDYVTSIDTKHVSAGQAVVVAAVARYLEAKPEASIEEITKLVEVLRVSCRMSFIPGGLEYLKAGGRVSNAAYIGAKILSLVPVIEILDGRLEATKKYRGSVKKVAHKLLAEYPVTEDLDKRMLVLILSEGLDSQLRQEIEDEARAMGFLKIRWIPTGCVVSSHCGPGSFGIVGFKKNAELDRIYAEAGIKG